MAGERRVDVLGVEQRAEQVGCKHGNGFSCFIKFGKFCVCPTGQLHGVVTCESSNIGMFRYEDAVVSVSLLHAQENREYEYNYSLLSIIMR